MRSKSWNLAITDYELAGGEKHMLDIEAAKILMASGLLNVKNVYEDFHYDPCTCVNKWGVWIDSKGWTG